AISPRLAIRTLRTVEHPSAERRSGHAQAARRKIWRGSARIYLVLKRHAPGPGRVGGRLRSPLARSRHPDTGVGRSAASAAARAAAAWAVSTAVSTAISSAVGSPLTTVRWGTFCGVLTAGC